MDQLRHIFPSINAQRLNDAIKTLKDNGSVYGIGKGVYEIAEAYPPARPVSVTIRDDGRRLLEIGDDIATLTPEEARRIRDAVQADGPVRDRLLTTRSAADILDCHPKTVFEYEKRGLIHAIRRSSRHIRWRASEVERLAITGGAV